MFALFRALTERLKALFITTVALDFEAELLTRDAECKAELLHQADRYEAEGLHLIAQPLRRQAEALSLMRPLATVVAATDYLLKSHPPVARPSRQRVGSSKSPAILPLRAPATKAHPKKGR